MRVLLKLVSVLLLGLLVAGCKENVHSNLAEREANEIVAVLYVQGVTASKTALKDGLFSVAVSQGEFSAAVAILSKAGLPRETFNTIGDVFPDDNVVGTPFEERARFSFALSQELSKTITEVEGVKYARVHVVIPEKGRFEDKAPPSKAALAVYHDSDFDPVANLPQMKKLVAFSVPNLTYDDVSVSLFQAGGLTDLVVEPVGPSGAVIAAATLTPSFARSQNGDLIGFLVSCAIFLTLSVLLIRFLVGIRMFFARFFAHGE